MSHLKHREELLSDIIEGIARHGGSKINDLIVTFECAEDPECSYEFALVNALECISNDLYWDERGNWSEATGATVHSI